MYVPTQGCGTGLGGLGCGNGSCSCEGTCGGGPLGLGAAVDPGELYNAFMTTSLPGENRRVNRRTDFLYSHLTPAQFAKVYGAEYNWATRYQQRTGVSGLGLFDSMDFTTWGLPEWGMVAVGAYLVLSLAGDTRRGITRVRKFRRKRKA